MQTETRADYDVVIMGGGIAGQFQARHLLLNVPGIRIALVDPRTEDRVLEIDKIGESMVEVAALFAYKDLGLHEYFIENQPPKNGLNFHWPKDPSKTGAMDDYFSIWNNRNPPIASFQIHRGRLEVDLQRMNVGRGMVHRLGKVVDVDLTPGDEPHRVHVERGDGTREILKAKHLVDAAGRRFIIGRKTDNVVTGPENLFGLNNGSVWVRVKNVDRTIFHDGYDPDNCATSHYYGTNHFFGHGHWLWMIPLDTGEMSLSVGAMFHHDQVDGKDLNTREKFYAFLKENHNVLYRLLESGEVIDFQYWPRVAHMPRTQMFSPDNWYVVGDAAYIGDAFYSMGTSTIAFAVSSVTEIVKRKLAGDPGAEEIRKTADDFNMWYSRTVIHLYHDHGKMLGNASVMSWRIYYEYIWWFGTHVPIFAGKWHLDPAFVRRLLANCERHFNAELYEELGELIARGKNIGFMDCYRADQLVFDYNTPKHFDKFIENAIWTPGMLNIYREVSRTYFYVAAWYAKFVLAGFGPRGFVEKPRRAMHLARFLKQAAKAAVLEKAHDLKHRGETRNPSVGRLRQEFHGYAYVPKLQPWTPASGEPAAAIPAGTRPAA